MPDETARPGPGHHGTPGDPGGEGSGQGAPPCPPTTRSPDSS